MDIIEKLDNWIGIEENYEPDLTEALVDFISLIDFDDLDENQIKYLDVVFEKLEESEELNELVKRVIRGGKVKRKKICRPGYKASGSKCIKIAAKEKRLRKKGAIRGAKKKRGQKSQIARKRARSMKRSVR